MWGLEFWIPSGFYDRAGLILKKRLVFLSLSFFFLPLVPPALTHFFLVAMQKLILPLLIVCYTSISEAFTPTLYRRAHGWNLFFENEQNGVSVMSLQGFENHEEDGERLAMSIQKWLDLEWCPQDVHLKIGLSAKQSYINSREKGCIDIMDIMVQVTDDLVAKWHEYDKDAFVNAWDIGNYASDFLHQMAGAERCACSVVLEEDNSTK